MANDLVLRVFPSGSVYDLDTPSDIDFRVDLSAIENTEIGSIFGIASQVFELPSSKTNDEFFSAAFNVNSTSVKGLKNSVDCQVLVNGGEIFKGNLILQEVITDGYNNTQYSVEVVNETIDFQTLIQDQYISDLDFSDYNHNYTMASITASWTGSLANGDIVYPLADYGVDSTDSTLPLIELGGVTGKMDSVNTPLKTIQFKPAIRAKALIDTMFDSVGYRYSSSFFDSADFNNIYVLPTSTDKLGIQSQASQDAGFYVNKTTSQTFVNDPAYSTLTWEAEQWDPSTGFNLATDTFTVQTAGAYAFKLQLNISAPDGTGIDITRKEFTVRVKVNGGATFSQFYDMVGNTTGIMTFVTPGQVLNAGDTVSVDARYRMDSDGTTPAASINNLLTFFQTVYAPTALIGGNVNMGQQFEEQAKSLDFLKGIIQMFNLVVEPKKDERKTLIIEPFDTWRNSGVIKDWTTKFDSATKISIKHPIQDQPRNLIHKLEDDDDSLNVFSKQQFDREYPYGTNFYTADSDIAQGDKVIGSFFAPTPTKGIGGGNNIIIPHLYKSDAGEKKPIKFKPRLLYLIPNRGTIDAVGGKIFVRSDTGLSVGKTSYPTLNHLSSLPADDSTTSLHFNANKWYPYHNNFAYGYTINGLFNEYWGRYINELYDDDARVMTCNIYFDPYELPTIQLNDKIFIKDAYYRINKISGFNLSKKESVQVELLKAAVSQFAFKRHRGVRVSNIKTADLTLSSFDTISGQATYVDINTGETYASGSFLKNIAKLDSLAFEGDKAVFTPAFNLTLQTDGRNALDGNFNQDQSIGYALGNITEGTIGKDVDRAIAVGSNINLQQNVRSALTIGDNLTVGSGSTFATILNSDGGNIINENNYGFIIGGSGSSIAGGDFVGVINSELATVRESDYTTLINGHTNDVILNGSGHLVLGLNNEGAGLDLLNYRNNSNYLGDTYQGGANFIEAKTLTCGDGTTINLYDTQYKHDSLFVLNWSGLSPGTTTINLPSLTNNDYEKIHYRIKANETFDGTTLVKLVPFTSPQTIQGFTSASFSSSYDYIELYANGTDWLILDGGGSISISGSGGGGGSTFPYTGSAIISGSLTVTGSSNFDRQIIIRNVPFGINAPNLSPTSTSSIAIGHGALVNLSGSGISVSNNIAIGTNALSSSVGGGNNIAIGNGALWKYKSTAGGNIAIGVAALWSIDSNLSNGSVALGGSALQSATTSTLSTMIGTGTGASLLSAVESTGLGSNNFHNGSSYRDIAIGRFNFRGTSGKIISSSECISIGYSGAQPMESTIGLIAIGSGISLSSSISSSNEIIIGYQAAGNGSNTVTLGNNSITDTYLKGRVSASNGFYGDGSNLTGVLAAPSPSIASGSVTASVSPNNGFVVNSSTLGSQFTGSVNVSGSVTAASFVGDGFGLTNIQQTAQNKFYDADTFTFDVPGDTTTTPVDIHVSQSGVYFISCSGVPAGVAGPRINIYYWPELLGNNETAKLKFQLPAGDTLTGVSYKANVTGSSAAEWWWANTASPSATPATGVIRNTTFKRMWAAGYATMVKDGSGRAFFVQNTVDVNITNFLYTGSSVNPLV